MISSRATTALLIAVTAIVFIILYGPIVVPIASSFFVVRHGAVSWDQPSLAAYGALVGNESVLEALRNTMIVGLAAVAGSMVLGTLLAFHYNAGRSKAREILQ
ncbi:MAG: hypothetical protein WEC41_07190, partial [Dongiaceae bacterium]